ncbi:MAG: glycosyltransferase [Ignavibacteriaceae bacterium]|nr:MAG: glycosyltransferase [Ignavibacteriaceae bacterium]MBV6445179.1 hypothetical protein [Ignavibacteriaceae bacterium]OQY70383.1 MAG: hypothetical protein B6D45_11275 [Ignavibacteriales bacterium UTCHB3]
MIILLSAIAGVFLFLQLIFLYGIRKSSVRHVKNNATGNRGYFSIVIAARNEEKNLSRLLDSLLAQSYPLKLYEILLCDDHSSDRTVEIALNYKNRLPNLSIITPEKNEPTGKRSALSRGIAAAKHDRILITDADCFMGKDWLETLDLYFTKSTDMLVGQAPLVKDKGFFNGLSCFSNLRSFLIISSSFGLGYPVSAIARNFGFRKATFQKVGGYKSTEGSLGGDDDLLLKAFITYGCKINLCNNPEAAVFSNTIEGTKGYLKQKARHTQASKFYSAKAKMMLGLWHFPNLLCLFAPVLVPWYPITGSLFILKFTVDLLTLHKYQREQNYSFKLHELIFYQFFYEIFLIINYLASRFSKFDWK